MFDIGFGELLLILIIGLVVLGPERLPVAVKTVAGWIRALRSLAASVQNELTQELKLQELQESLKKAEQAGLQNLTPELKASMDELKEMAESLQRSYHADKVEPPQADTHPQVTDPEAIYDGSVPAETATNTPPSPEPAAGDAPSTGSSAPDPAAKPEQPPVMANIQEPAAVQSPASQQPSGER